MTNKSNKENSDKCQKAVKFYKKHYKKFIVLPVILFVLSVLSIGLTLKSQDSPIYRDVSLKGGLSAVVEVRSEIEAGNLQGILEEKYSDYSFVVSTLTSSGEKVGFIIDTDLSEEELILGLNGILKIELKEGDNFTSNFISPTLSNSFFTQALFALSFSLIFMAAVVFLYFKEFVPSSAVVLSAIFDIIVTVGVLDFFEFKISVAGIGAIVMLVGYSIDTDILLTNRLIKEPGKDYFEKTFFAFKTGSLMSFTTLIAGVGALVLTNSNVIFEIAMILVVGLLVDYVSTWIQNAGILLWWLEKKN